MTREYDRQAYTDSPGAFVMPRNPGIGAAAGSPSVDPSFARRRRAAGASASRPTGNSCVVTVRIPRVTVPEYDGVRHDAPEGARRAEESSHHDVTVA